MLVFCSKCGTSSDVAGSASSAACSACGAALPVNMPAFGPPQGGHKADAFGLADMAAVPRVVPPRINFTWQEQQLGGGAWSVAVRERTTAGCAVVALLALSSMGVGSYIFGTAEGDTTVPVVVFAVVAAFFGYKALCLAVNRGSLRVDQGWLAMSRRPLPEKPGTRVPTASIAQFRPVKTMTVKSGTTRTTYWGIQVLSADGTLTRLPMGNMPREQADYVCERLTVILKDVQKRCGIMPPQIPVQYQQPVI
jgi:hypothetical protein